VIEREGHIGRRILILFFLVRETPRLVSSCFFSEKMIDAEREGKRQKKERNILTQGEIDALVLVCFLFCEWRDAPGCFPSFFFRRDWMMVFLTEDSNAKEK